MNLFCLKVPKKYLKTIKVLRIKSTLPLKNQIKLVCNILYKHGRYSKKGPKSPSKN